MTDHSVFHFKKFQITHGNSAMKIGTDSVLLGAWADVTRDRYILDIGTGSGLIAIMLAQKNPSAEIIGVEIERKAFEEAFKNANNCPWSDRIIMIHSSIQEFVIKKSNSYDTIITNPPFFNSGVPSLESGRARARHTHFLSHTELIEVVDNLLGSKGKFYCILPPGEAENIIELAKYKQLHLNHVVHLSPTEKKPNHRTLMKFSRNRLKTVKESMVINASGSGEYSRDYKSLTKDFYLYM